MVVVAPICTMLDELASKTPGKIDKQVAETGEKWRFFEGSRSAISPCPSRRC
jgi:hypothetical protein